MSAGDAIVAGFYGKLPARGDFVRFGLPRDFTDPWDDWLQRVIAASKQAAGDAWLEAYLESPVWRFALPAGLCGSRAALGVLLPSVDSVGRYFPLVLAALGPFGLDAPDACAAWLDRCEEAGRAALEQDLTPEQVGARLDAPPLPVSVNALSSGLWWTEGAPRVPAGRFSSSGMPDAALYATMIGVGVDARADGAAGGNGDATWITPS